MQKVSGTKKNRDKIFYGKLIIIMILILMVEVSGFEIT